MSYRRRTVGQKCYLLQLGLIAYPWGPSNAPQAAISTPTLPSPWPPPATYRCKGWLGLQLTCQWLQLDQGTARAHGQHTEVAESPLDTFLEVLSGWGLHWNDLWRQPPRMNKLHTPLAAKPRPSLPPTDRATVQAVVTCLF